MPRRIAIIFWYCQLTVWANAQIPPAMKLLTMGDSITYGYSPAGSPGGYRTVLYEDLTGFGITVHVMGTQTSNPSQELSAAGAIHHEGHPGYMITGGQVNGSFQAGLGENVGQWLSGLKPDIIFLMIGSNDLALGYDLPNAPARMAALLDRISALSPQAKIVVSTVLYSRIEATNKAITEFNQALFPITMARKSVYLLDLSHVLTIPADYDDDYDPNPGGYDKLGHAIAVRLKPFEESEILKRN